MQAREVRLRILQGRAALRERLAEIESLAERCEAGDEDAGARLRERAAALYEAVAAQLRLEDRLLGAAMGALPPERSEALAHRVEREHREQRELVGFLRERLRTEDRPAVLVGRELQAFSRCVRDDMAHEERTLLADLFALG